MGKQGKKRYSELDLEYMRIRMQGQATVRAERARRRGVRDGFAYGVLFTSIIWLLWG